MNHKHTTITLSLFFLSVLLAMGGASGDFKKAQKNDTEAVYQSFIVKYPASEFTEQAKARLETLVYERISRTGGEEDWKEYLAKYPQGSQVGDAKSKLDALRFKQAEAINTEASYQGFISNAFSADLKRQAQAAVDKLRKQEKEVAFLRACEYGNGSAVREYLEQGGNPDATNEVGNSALILATHAGRSETLKVLLEHGAKPNMTDKHGTSSLMFAVENDSVDDARALLAAGADVNYSAPDDGLTVLMIATADGNADMMRLLLSKGAKADHRSKAGGTALEQAIYEGYMDIAEMLIAAGANANNVRSDGKSSLLDAVRIKDYPMVCLLLKAGAKDQADTPCLKEAQLNNDADIVRILKAAAEGSFDYADAMKQPAANRPTARPPLPKGYATMNSTATILFIEGRKVAVMEDGGGPAVLRAHGRTAFKVELPKDKQTGSELYQTATLSDFKAGDKVTIETSMGSTLLLEMRKGPMHISSDKGVQTQ